MGAACHGQDGGGGSPTRAGRAQALPDARDGLKPVHRRILYSMHENNYTPDRAYNKSARVTGDIAQNVNFAVSGDVLARLRGRGKTPEAPPDDGDRGR